MVEDNTACSPEKYASQKPHEESRVDSETPGTYRKRQAMIGETSLRLLMAHRREKQVEILTQRTVGHGGKRCCRDHQ